MPNKHFVSTSVHTSSQERQKKKKKMKKQEYIVLQRGLTACAHFIYSSRRGQETQRDASRFPDPKRLEREREQHIEPDKRSIDRTRARGRRRRRRSWLHRSLYTALMDDPRVMSLQLFFSTEAYIFYCEMERSGILSPIYNMIIRKEQIIYIEYMEI